MARTMRKSLILLIVFYTIAISALPSEKKDDDRLVKSNTIMGKQRAIWDNKVDITDGLVVSFSMDYSSSTKVSKKEALKLFFGASLDSSAKKDYTRDVTSDHIRMAFHGGDTTVKIKRSDFHQQCYQIEWFSRGNGLLQDCFDSSDTYWYGLGEMFNQKWPINNATTRLQPFMTTDYLMSSNPAGGSYNFGGILEPLTVNNNGGGMYVSETGPLHVSINENGNKKLCISRYITNCDSRNERTKSSSHSGRTNSTNGLKYTICIANNIKNVHHILSNNYIDKPRGFPDTRMIKDPIWSTWALFKKRIDQEKILKFAENIKENGFNASHLIIEDKWSQHYGDFYFDMEKFTCSKLMIDILQSKGFRIMLWITPFCSLDSKQFRNGFEYWLKTGKNDGPAIVKWWNGYATILDTTKAASKKWFLERVNTLKKMKIAGFKLDGGETTHLPTAYMFDTIQPNPNYYTYHYVKMAAEMSKLVEVRVGYKSQKFPVFVRLLDRRSDWNSQGGLRSIIPAVLTLSILGYPFITPDMIGGNNYLSSPNTELYVRWVQLTAFLPSVQFSIPPWQYSKTVMALTRTVLKIREQLSPYMIELAKDVQYTGNPIVRPLWWLWPNDPQTFIIDQAFMLGNRYLIAPVVQRNAKDHIVYLPAGVWEEQWGSKKILRILKGTFQRYQVTLKDVLYFRLAQPI